MRDEAPCGPSARSKEFQIKKELHMLKKSALSAMLAALTLGAATIAFAAPAAPAPAPAPAPEAAAPAKAAVSMAEAVAAAEKAYKAEAFRTTLAPTPRYGLVWDVRMSREDGSRVRALVDAATGKILAANDMGILPNGPRAGKGPGMGPGAGMGPRPDCPYGGPGMGMGPGAGMGPGCPMGGPRHHRHWGCR